MYPVCSARLHSHGFPLIYKCGFLMLHPQNLQRLTLMTHAETHTHTHVYYFDIAPRRMNSSARTNATCKRTSSRGLRSGRRHIVGILGCKKISISTYQHAKRQNLLYFNRLRFYFALCSSTFYISLHSLFCIMLICYGSLTQTHSFAVGMETRCVHRSSTHLFIRRFANTFFWRGHGDTIDPQQLT